MRTQTILSHTFGATIVLALVMGVGVVGFAVRPAAAAGLTVATTDGQTSATPGDATTYATTLTNSDSADATGVQVTDTLPGNYGSVTAISDGGVLVGNTITWNALTVSANGAKTVSFSGKIGLSFAVGTTTLTNTATLGCTSNPSCPFSGSATDTTTVSVAPIPIAGQPALTLAQRLSVDTLANPGDVITYTLTVANSSSATAAAQGVVLTVTLPAGFTFRTDGTSVSTFSMSDLAPGDTRTLTFDVKIGDAVASGTYDSVVAAKGANTESIPAISSVRVRAPIVLGESVDESTDETPPVQVLAETGAGPTDFAIGSGAVILVVAGALIVRRRPA